MKGTFLILMLSAVYLSGNAQTKESTTASRISVGVEAGIPVGENGKPYASILGGSLQYEARPDFDLGITINGGYLSYSIKQSHGSGSIGFVPLLAGVKYYFTPGAFFHAQLGAAVGTDEGQGTRFAYSPGIGFKLSSNFDTEFKYMGVSNKSGSLNNVGLRLAYNF